MIPSTPLNLPSLWQARSIYILADAARDLVQSEQAEDALAAVCDRLLTILISNPVRQARDVLVKLWLLDLAGERTWDHDYCARTVIGQLMAYMRRGGSL